MWITRAPCFDVLVDLCIEAACWFLLRRGAKPATNWKESDMARVRRLVIVVTNVFGVVARNRIFYVLVVGSAFLYICTASVTLGEPGNGGETRGGFGLLPISHVRLYQA